MYKCGWNGCEKAYGTLNHLNAHVTMQSHGQKRTPEGEFAINAAPQTQTQNVCPNPLPFTPTKSHASLYVSTTRHPELGSSICRDGILFHLASS
jgi:hypothetical protein